MVLRNHHCIFQADDKFWRVKYDHEEAKKARKAKKAAKKAAPRKKGSRPTASELLQLSDSSESEVIPRLVSSCYTCCFSSVRLINVVLSTGGHQSQ